MHGVPGHGASEDRRGQGVINSPTPLPLARPLLSYISHDLDVLSGIEELEGMPRREADAVLEARVSPEDDRAFDRGLETIDWHHRERCSFFWACHNRAEAEDWQGLSCVVCRAYTEERVSARELPLSKLRAATIDARRVRTVYRVLLKASPSERPIITATAERRGGRHVILRGAAVALALAEIGERTARVVLVGRASCPFCDTKKSVRKNGRCPVCRLYLEARGMTIGRGGAPMGSGWGGGRTSQQTDLVIEDLLDTEAA